MYKPLIPIAGITMYIICETSLISISIDTKTRQFISYDLFPVSTIDGFDNINVRSHERVEKSSKTSTKIRRIIFTVKRSEFIRHLSKRISKHVKSNIDAKARNEERCRDTKRKTE